MKSENFKPESQLSLNFLVLRLVGIPIKDDEKTYTKYFVLNVKLKEIFIKLILN